MALSLFLLNEMEDVKTVYEKSLAELLDALVKACTENVGTGGGEGQTAFAKSLAASLKECLLAIQSPDDLVTLCALLKVHKLHYISIIATFEKPLCILICRTGSRALLLSLTHIVYFINEKRSISF